MASIAAALLLGTASFAANAVNVPTVVLDSHITTLDPYDANDTISQAVAKSVYEGLFGFDKDGHMRPVLATGWSVDTSGLVYTISLREGIVFHDGTPFTAKSVRASFERAADPANNLRRHNLFEVIRAVEVVNDHLVKIHLKRPFSSFVNHLAHPSSVIMCPKTLKEFGNGIAYRPCGTGQFRVNVWDPASGMLTVSKNEHYWRKNLPRLDGITWITQTDDAERLDMLTRGRADFTNSLPFDTDEKSLGNDIEVLSGDTFMQRFIAMNVHIKPFDDVNVRRAVNLAIDKEAIARDVFNGHATPSKGPMPAQIEYSTAPGPWEFNIEKARELLAKAGYPDGFEGELWSIYNNTTSKKVIEHVAGQLAKVGIRLKTRVLTATERRELIETKNLDMRPAMCYFGWSSSTGEADWGLRPIFESHAAPPKGFNIGGYGNPEVDKCIAEALQTTDRKAKSELYGRAQQILWDDAAVVYMIEEKSLYAHRKSLSGFFVQPDKGLDFGHAVMH